MSIVTKTGDKGETGVMGKRLSKDDVLLETIGELDELMAVMGIVKLKIKINELIIKNINNDLYKISGLLAGWKVEIDLIYKKEKKMKLVNRFLKPGDDLDVWLNWARTVCRRAERRMVSLNKVEKIDKNILIFINRLSDYLFIIEQGWNSLTVPLR
ncbi:MAG: ATP:cob(I)alamin adenosyltransferase [Candidatus Shapirobacteria bacterium GW2011_GWE1_38_92]|uniref:Corrinoid adenosyltransferase n=1 Tax=Candidatus Shapirobacteria bacterium GW2011_GWE1_38_92 TaxID=1618489 RepID=A0A0G0PLT6_9BACT|nr:MAG: ATP:cob(I)alamin adenosyltransferase [Candidatus Shapirobacteria bacterium GW2011_GWE1_38_92]